MSPALPSTPAQGLDLTALYATFSATPAEEACSLAREIYGIDAQATRFATEKDDTFRLTARDGSQYVLKIANPADALAELEFQVAILEHILARSPDLPVPRVVRTKRGEGFTSIVDGAGRRRGVRLMTYLRGAPLDTIASTPAEREKIGAMLGRLRLTLADFDHPYARRVVTWDVSNVLGLAHLNAEIADRRQADLLGQALARIEGLGPRLAGLRRQVLHNDFNRSNIVVDRAEPAFITGIIDFGDAVHTAIAIDVSTALLNQLPRNTGQLPSEDMFADPRDVLRGYLGVAELNPEELAMIPHLVMARVVARALLSTVLARRFPDKATYLLRNTEQGWAQLKWFLRRSEDEVSAVLRRAPHA